MILKICGSVLPHLFFSFAGVVVVLCPFFLNLWKKENEKINVWGGVVGGVVMNKKNLGN